MSQLIDFDAISATIAKMDEIANEIDYVVNTFRYNYPNVPNEGKYSNVFENTKNTIEEIAKDMCTFVRSYADLLGVVSGNYQKLDQDLRIAITQ